MKANNRFTLPLLIASVLFIGQLSAMEGEENTIRRFSRAALNLQKRISQVFNEPAAESSTSINSSTVIDLPKFDEELDEESDTLVPSISTDSKTSQEISHSESINIDQKKLHEQQKAKIRTISQEELRILIEGKEYLNSPQYYRDNPYHNIPSFSDTQTSISSEKKETDPYNNVDLNKVSIENHTSLDLCVVISTELTTLYEKPIESVQSGAKPIDFFWPSTEQKIYLTILVGQMPTFEINNSNNTNKIKIISINGKATVIIE